MKKRTVFVGAMIFLAALLLCVVSAGADGWTKDGDHLMYYQGETPMVDSQTVDGKIYTFSAEGFLEGNGKVQYAGTDYYFIDASNKLQYGWQTVEGDKYYFDPETGKALRARYSWDGDHLAKYHGNRPDGYLHYASWKIDESWYVFDYQGVLMINQWSDLFYGNSKGKILTGYQKAGDDWCCFNEYGKAQTGFIKIDGAFHYFDTNGKELRGWNKILSDWYYFGESDGIMKTGSLTVGKYKYSLGSNGTLNLTGNTALYDSDSTIGIDGKGNHIKGWQTIGGNTYYFDYKGKAYEGYHYLQPQDESRNYFFFFDESGVMQTYRLMKLDPYNRNEEAYYYFGEDGKAITGWCTVNGATYYFEPKSVVGRKRLKADDDNDYYYFFFDENSVMQTNQLIYGDSWIHYFGADGKAITGWKTVNGSTYYFGPNAFTSCSINLEQDGKRHRYLFDEFGRVIAIDGKEVKEKYALELSGVQFDLKKATAGTEITITAKTSLNAAKLVMYSGSKAVQTWTRGYTDSGEVRTWKVTYAFAGAGERTVDFKAADVGGVLTAAKSATITITAAPKLSGVKFAKAQATVNQKATITAVTNTAAVKLTMYSGGKAVKSWKSGYTDKDGKRTWKVTYAFAGAGERTMDFRAMDESGVLTEPKSASIIITKAPVLKSVKFAKAKATVNQKVTITAVTNTTAAKLTMYSGSKAIQSWKTGYTDKDGKRTWKVTYAFSGAGARTMDFKAADANGVLTEAKSAKITVTKAPKLSSVKFSKDQAKVNEEITIVAVTNTLTTKLTMYAGTKAVKSWKEGYTDKDGKRTWKVKYAFSGKGERTLDFKGFDANGVATAAKTATITITK